MCYFNTITSLQSQYPTFVIREYAGDHKATSVNGVVHKIKTEFEHLLNILLSCPVTKMNTLVVIRKPFF